MSALSLKYATCAGSGKCGIARFVLRAKTFVTRTTARAPASRMPSNRRWVNKVNTDRALKFEAILGYHFEQAHR